MSFIHERFDKLDIKISSLESKIDALLLHMVPDEKAQGQIQSSALDSSHMPQLQTLSTRIERLELLLMRTSLEDFVKLDTELLQLLPSAAPSK